MPVHTVIESRHHDGDDTVAAAEKLLGTPLVLWTQVEPGQWQSETRLPTAGALDAPDSVGGLLAECCRDRQPRVTELAPGRQWVAIPLSRPGRTVDRIATATLFAADPRLPLQLARATQQCLEQQAELCTLRGANDDFVKQISDSFEELAFLRTLAEHLALGDAPTDLVALTCRTLPLLGEATNAETLVYVQSTQGNRERIAEVWEAAGAGDRIDQMVLETLVERFRENARNGPVVRNHVDRTDLGQQLPGIRGFALVSVGTTFGAIGWLLAVNRRRPEEQVRRGSLCNANQEEFGTSEASLMGTTAAMIASYAHNVAFLEEKELLLVNMVRCLVSAIDSRDPYTCGHSERVALFGARLAKELGDDEESCQRLYLSGLLHDVGKIGVPDAVLKKDGPLSDEEFAEIKRHPEIGWSILHDLTHFDYVLPGVLHHHERIDGKGYPDELAGDDIPREARILAVADAYDAMTSDRPYRRGLSQEKAEAILQGGAGTQWDAEFIATFMRIMPEIVALRESHEHPPAASRRPAAAIGVGPLLAEAPCDGSPDTTQIQTVGSVSPSPST